jgi:thiol-disulfide isomerase/thioredoxin
MKKNLIYFFYLLVISFSANSQTINLEFPYFAGKTYDFTIFQGEKRITLKAEAIPQGGKVQLIIPEEYKGYKGIAQWYLTNSATGGGLDLVINNEDFSVSCLDSIPNENNIIYKNTTENLFDKANYKKQQILFEKHDAMLAAKRAYDSKKKLYKLANKEYNSLIIQYEAHSKALNSSTLYAAKFRQIVNLTMGIGPKITLDENEKARDINHFMVNELDYEVLYTSNHWGGIIGNWVQLQKMVIKDDAKMIADATTILNRIQTDKVYTDYVIDLTKELTREGKDDVLFALIKPVKNAKRLLNYDGVLSVFKQDLTGKARDLIVSTSEGSTQTTILKTDELNSKYTLLFFYQSECGHCETAIAALKSNYQELTDKGIKITSIAGDLDPKTFETNAASFPWTTKYREVEGMSGVNFKNYAVIGTPTMFLLDSKGMIIEKVATVEELLEWSRK